MRHAAARRLRWARRDLGCSTTARADFSVEQARIRRIACAGPGDAVSAASVVAFGANVFGAAIAVAERSDLAWDIEAYDDCMNKTIRDANQCCIDSGGVPSDEPLDGGNGRSKGVGSADCSPGKLRPGILTPIGPAQGRRSRCAATAPAGRLGADGHPRSHRLGRRPAL